MPEHFASFDVWLNHDLRRRYNQVLNEPLPENLATLLASLDNDD